jgi:transposase-like protein
VIYKHISLCHDLLEIAQAQRISKIPSNAQDDDFGFEMSTLEQRWPVPSHERPSLSDRVSSFATMPIKVKGRWTYLYRAVDKHGRTVDFLLSERRDVAAAKHFFRKAMKNNGTPRVITLDAYAASHRAITELKSAGTMPHRVRIRSSKYLNNVVEQDHRRIKHWIRPMLGFKRFEAAEITISGIELAEKIRKHQFKTGKLLGRPSTAPET